MDLMVERRRIYDVVNILEALQVVVKKGRNTYMWKGRNHLVCQFALMQQEAVENWPEYAAKYGITEKDPDSVAKSGQQQTYEKEESKSLTRLSQLFLQVFLVGFDNVNLPQVSELIHGRKPSAEEFAKIGNQGQDPPKDPQEFHKLVGRGLKTKIRRLYDVANVLLAIGLLRKTENRIARTVEGKRPHYHWNFTADAKQLRSVYESLEDRTKTDQNPFLERIVLEAAEKTPSPEKKPIETKVVTVKPSIKPEVDIDSATSFFSEPPEADADADTFNEPPAFPEDAPVETEAAAPSFSDVKVYSEDGSQQVSPPVASAGTVKSEQVPPSACFKEVEINATSSSTVAGPLSSKEMSNGTCSMDDIVPPPHYEPAVLGTENVGARETVREGKATYFDPIASEVARGGQLLMKSMI